MRTKINHSIKDQELYLEKKNSSDDFLHWIINKNGLDFAYCMAHNYIPYSKNITWGFWIGNPNFLGMGGFIASFFYNFIFSKTNIKSITAEVLDHNKQVLSMHKSMGYEEHKVIENKLPNDRKMIEKILILHKEKWIRNSKSLLKLEAKFELSKHANSLYKTISKGI